MKRAYASHPLQQVPAGSSDSRLPCDTLTDDEATIVPPERLSARAYRRLLRQTGATEETESAATLLAPRVYRRMLEATTAVKVPQPSRPQPGASEQPVRALFSRVALLLALLLSVCEIVSDNYNLQNQLQASGAKAQVYQQFRQAVALGIPAQDLEPLLQQAYALDQQSPFNPHSSLQAETASYQRYLLGRYRALSQQITHLIPLVIHRLARQAQRDLQDFQNALAQLAARGLSSPPALAQIYSQDQVLLSAARYPRDYLTISADSQTAVSLLTETVVVSDQLTELAREIASLQAAHLDVSALQTRHTLDLQAFQQATTIDAMQELSAQLTAQQQDNQALAMLAFPSVSVARLQALQAQIEQLKHYGVDTRPYLPLLKKDTAALRRVRTLEDKQAFYQSVAADLNSLGDVLIRGEARFLVKSFHMEASAWGEAHLYYDSYDGQSYSFTSGYSTAGIGTTLDNDLAGARTLADFQNVTAEANNAFFLLHTQEANFQDQMAYNQAHASDLKLLARYQLRQKQVLVISLTEQVLRVYQRGRLVRAMYVTTGRPERPSLPGVWSVQDRRSPVIFRSADPRNSPYWFPDTPISYAILYHWGGFFLHDAPWRADFGPGTQFPHRDRSGTTAFNFDGSHGCINLSESDAAWIYKHTDWNTTIVIY
jgi:hypothetical protein